MNFRKNIFIGTFVVFFAFCLISVGFANAEEKKEDAAELQEITIEAPKAELKDTFEDFMPLPTAKFKVKKEGIETINAVTVEDAVRYLPSVEIRRRYIGDPNRVISMRGNGNFQTARHMLFVDGFPLHSMLRTRWNGAPQFNFVAPGETESVADKLRFHLQFGREYHTVESHVGAMRIRYGFLYW